MKTIEKITLEKRLVNWSSSKCNDIAGIEYTKMCYLTNGASIKVGALLSYIGNENLDNWNNVEKMKKSTSNNNIKKYLDKFINSIEII